ncbi:MAG: methyltransferase domain-containing protein [Chloroflexota bacterium]
MTSPMHLEIDQLGFAHTLQQSQRVLAAVASHLDLCLGDPSARLTEPFFFDSTSVCLSTYIEALDLVQARFWTTTFLNSGFWTSQDTRIMAANTRLMRRLGAAGGHARRLFLLDQTPEQVVQAYREQRILLDRLGKQAELSRLDADFENLWRNVQALQAEGCELRVVSECEQPILRLSGEMRWQSQVSELAIYDDFRVDVFETGAGSKISSVVCFSRAMKDFARYRQAAETFFSCLWERGDEMALFLERLQEAVESARSRIHYRANWLARYEFALDEKDTRLKQMEGQQTEQLLREQGRWGQIGSYLDVGTCTGRYLLRLCHAVREDGAIIGIDDDPESIQFARSNVVTHCNGDQRISVLLRNFAARELSLPGAPFQLITCMMSTLSHFGRHRQESLHDPLQATLCRLAGLLDEEGLLIFSTWSDYACRTWDFLSIYEEKDCQRLADWTPPEAELKRRLPAAGLTARLLRPDRRLNLWVCTR